MSHHAATILLIPGSLFFVLSAHPKKALTLRSLLAFGLGAMLGLSFLLYLPLRFLAKPAFNYVGTFDADLNFHPVDLTTLSGLWWLVSGRGFTNVMMGYNLLGFWHEAQKYLIQLSRAFFAIGIGPGLLGVGLLFRRSWKEGGMLLLMFLSNAVFYINYRVLDKDTMYLPTYLIWTLWAALGFQGLLEWVRQIETERLRKLSLSTLSMLMLGGAFLSLVWNWRIVDLSQDWSSRQRGETILRNVERGALIFGWWDVAPVVQYLQFVEGKRPDVWAINRFLIAPNDLASAMRKEVSDRPIYIDDLPTGLSATWSAVPAGPVYRLRVNQCHMLQCRSTQEQRSRR